MRITNRIICRSLLVALASLALFASCTRPPQVTEVPDTEPREEQRGNEQTGFAPGDSFRRPFVYEVPCRTTPAFTSERRVNPNEFAIDPNIVPNFAIFAGVGTINSYIIATEMSHVPQCDRYIVIAIFTDQPEEIAIQPLENWRAVAGTEANNALNRLEEECEFMSPEEARIRFGAPFVRTPQGEIVEIEDPSDACRSAARSHVYGLRIRGPAREIIVSNVFGTILIEEVN